MLYRILGLAAAATLGYLVKPMANRCKDASPRTMTYIKKNAPESRK
jgi:hypothetical protein